jgi:hypothetical protein
MISLEVVGLLKEVFTVQELRAVAYNRLVQGRTTELGSTSGIAYQNLIAATTSQLQELSARVRRVEACLRELQETRVADLVNDLQQSEKVKLELTATIETIKFAQKQHEIDLQREKTGRCGPDTSFQILANGAELSVVRDETYKALEECILRVHETMDELKEFLY